VQHTKLRAVPKALVKLILEYRNKLQRDSYYPCQTRHGAKVLGSAIRAHWGIENRAHYVRDVTLGEDASRIRTRPGVMARIRSVTLNILRANGVQNISLELYANAVSFNQLLALGTA